MSKLGWAARIGGYAGAPFTFGLSVPAGQLAAQQIEKKQASNDPLAPGTTGKSDSKSDPTIDPYTALLNQQATGAQAQGEQSNAMGTDALAPVMKYLQSILGGDPSALMDATRGERGRVIDQYDTARRSAAEFGPRGGGTTGALAKSRFDQASSLADITSGARRDAVATEGELGVQLKQLGLSAEQLASSDLNAIINAALNKQYLDVQKRGQNAQTATGIGQVLGNIIGIILTRDKAGGGTPTPTPAPTPAPA